MGLHDSNPKQLKETPQRYKPARSFRFEEKTAQFKNDRRDFVWWLLYVHLW